MRGELDFLKVLIAGADGVVVASIDSGRLRLQPVRQLPPRLPARRITTKLELTSQNDPRAHARRSATGSRSPW
jgi:hypothetical protein